MSSNSHYPGNGRPGGIYDASRPASSVFGKSDHNRLLTDSEIGADLWRRYVQHTTEQDNVTFRRWQSDMDSLLIFAALFSAVLTAFVVASYPALQEPHDDISLSSELLVEILAVLRNSSVPAVSLSNSTFHPTSSDVRINAAWFTSLILSLMTAFIAILAKQWVHYLAVDLSMLPVTGGCQRQFRYEGWHTWKLPSVLSFLPVILHISLLLFFAGLIDFLWHINIVVAALPMVFIFITVMLYSLATSFAITSPSCPYKTPATAAITRFAFSMKRRGLELVKRMSSESASQTSLRLSRPQTFTDQRKERFRAFIRSLLCRLLDFIFPQRTEEDIIHSQQEHLEASALVHMIAFSTHPDDVITLAHRLSRSAKLIQYRSQFVDAGILEMLVRHFQSLHLYLPAIPGHQYEEAILCTDVLAQLTTVTSTNASHPTNSQLLLMADTIEPLINGYVGAASLDHINNFHLRANLLRLLVFQQCNVASSDDHRDYGCTTAILDFYTALYALHSPHISALPDDAWISIIDTIVYIGLNHLRFRRPRLTADPDLFTASLGVLAHILLQIPSLDNRQSVSVAYNGIFALHSEYSGTGIALLQPLSQSVPSSVMICSIMERVSCTQPRHTLHLFLTALSKFLELEGPHCNVMTRTILVSQFASFIAKYSLIIHSEKDDLTPFIVERLLRISGCMIHFAESAQPTDLEFITSLFEILRFVSAHADERPYRSCKWIWRLLCGGSCRFAEFAALNSDELESWTVIPDFFSNDMMALENISDAIRQTLCKSQTLLDGSLGDNKRLAASLRLLLTIIKDLFNMPIGHYDEDDSILRRLLIRSGDNITNLIQPMLVRQELYQDACVTLEAISMYHKST